MSKHENNGNCPECTAIIGLYPGFNQTLLSWFKLFQAKHPEVHASDAGRGYVEQEKYFARGATKAHFGHSAHNYNCALDTFVNLPGKSIYDDEWYCSVLAPEIPSYLCWYGAKGAPFFELPHIELKNWKSLRDQKALALVEPPAGSVV